MKPGPSKGEGGRPRKPMGKGKVREDGYRRTTVGAKGKGRQVYEHRAKMGMTGKGSKGEGMVVHHRDHVRSHNTGGNLKRTTKRRNSKDQRH